MNKKCQVFTPKNTVIELLDRVGYIQNLLGKKIIENACGDGNILVVIVERYIEDCFRCGYDLQEIKSGLETDIYGAEIDENHYKQCIINLNSAAEKYNIFDVNWNILNVDILRTTLPIKFDYVIGNPPYINYRDLDVETRDFLKTNYEVCPFGKFDYCYAFIEASLKCLNDVGKLSYLIPSSIFKNVFAQKLRDFMLPTLCRIYDYTTIKLFDTAITSSSIIIVDKGKQVDIVEYFDINRNISYGIEKKQLTGKWLFSGFKEKNVSEKKKFGDFFSASISIATLLNEAFVLYDFEEHDGFISVREIKIEKEIIRETVSPRSLNENKKRLIIFPYKYEDGKLVRFDEDEFLKKFPGAANYLRNFSDKLSKRVAAKNVRWYEYGRSQALAHLEQKKLLTSSVVTKAVKVYELTKECVPYSGIYIVSKGALPLTVAKKILESKCFYNYVQNIGIHADGSSVRITAADINNFEFFENEV